MNIYDEAIEKVDWIFSNSKIPNYELRSICVALTRAKKVEELLENVKDILALNYSYQEIGIKISRLFKRLEEV